ncbi:hypothetical protein OG563_24755 [Nocardia vinacea]|uniref:AB hydrolase-1 domain-containing protein n=1 Tax=Nocardia vinacea TaxID=96468 RepID=A0ABZ1YGY6_9NOCA|nr:alpha/beta fold hydrolase [Nocardia vinacea]
MLLPGGTVSLHTYRDMIPALAEHHTVYAVDLPGNGYTTVNDPNFSYDLAAMTASGTSSIVPMSRKHGFAGPNVYGVGRADCDCWGHWASI